MNVAGDGLQAIRENEAFIAKHAKVRQVKVFPKRTERASRLKAGQLSESEQELLDKRLGIVEAALRHTRLCLGKKVCHAEWSDDDSLAKVTVTRGSLIATMGIWRSKSHWLHPEEALYLVDKGVIRLSMAGTECSFQRAFAVLLPASGMSMSEFIVYCHFRRTGYVIRRLDDTLPAQIADGVPISFAVWATNTFRRKNPIDPIFYVAVFNSMRALPSQEELQKTVDRFKTVHVCAVDLGTIAICSIHTAGINLDENSHADASDHSSDSN